MSTSEPRPSGKRPVLPTAVWTLGFVSLFMDISSETIHALLPLFLTTTLGASVAFVGLIDGVAEATASISKVFSGYISDRIGRRKPLILMGYGLGALSKPLFALAGSANLVLGARFADRIGKGLRGAPRDALIADVTPVEIRGRAFGLRQALDTAGAFLGPLLAIAMMFLFANNIRSVFWVAIIPAAIAVLLVLFGLKNERSIRSESVSAPVQMHAIFALGRPYWSVVGIGVVFTMARFSEAFLVLKASAEGLPLALAPMVLVVLNLVYALGAYPAGAWSDAVPARRLMLWGLACLFAADLMLAYFPGLVAAFVGIALWGAHLAITQGLMAKLVADTSPAHLRGSAFGLFNLASGLTLLFSSVLAGLLWDRFGSGATFLAGASFAGVAFVGLIVGHRNRPTAPE